MAGRTPVKHSFIRVRDIPPAATEESFTQLLSKHSSSGARPRVHLVPNCTVDNGNQVAIVRFSSGLPGFLSKLENDPVGDGKYPEMLDDRSYTFDKNFFGLTQLYHTKKDVKISADIIAVTGLNGRAFDSWRGQDPNGEMWLKDFFQKDLPSARTMTYGYNTKWQSPGIFNIGDFANDLSRRIETARKWPCPSDRPIIFIAHSFGTLLVAKMLRQWKMNSEASPLEATRAVLFFGAPLRGMDNKDLNDMAKDIGADHRKNLLESLRNANRELQDFIQISKSFMVFTFYECRQTPKLARSETSASSIPYSRSGPYSTCVSPQSSILGLSAEHEKTFPVDADHSTMVKFDHRDSEHYQDALNSIKKVLKVKDTMSSIENRSTEAEPSSAPSPQSKPAQSVGARGKQEDAKTSQTAENWHNNFFNAAELAPPPNHESSQSSVETNAVFNSDAERFDGLLHSLQGPNQKMVSKILKDMGPLRAISYQDSTGKTVLHHAAMKASSDMLFSLIENLSPDDFAEMIDSRTKDSSGKAPLHYAAQYGNEKAIESLIEHSRDPYQYFLEKTANADSVCAMDLAMKHGQNRSISLLQRLQDEGPSFAFLPDVRNGERQPGSRPVSLYCNGISVARLNEPRLHNKEAGQISLALPLVGEKHNMKKAIEDWIKGKFGNSKHIRFQVNRLSVEGKIFKSKDVSIEFQLIESHEDMKSKGKEPKSKKTPFAIICFSLEDNPEYFQNRCSKRCEIVRKRADWNPSLVFLGLSNSNKSVRPKTPNESGLVRRDTCEAQAKRAGAHMYIEVARKNNIALDRLFDLLIRDAVGLNPQD